MRNTVVKAEGIGKKYLIGTEKTAKYVALRDVVSDSVDRVKNRFLHSNQAMSQKKENFWALQNVSFEIEQGDRVGIIGPEWRW